MFPDWWNPKGQKMNFKAYDFGTKTLFLEGPGAAILIKGVAASKTWIVSWKRAVKNAEGAPYFADVPEWDGGRRIFETYQLQRAFDINKNEPERPLVPREVDLTTYLNADIALPVYFARKGLYLVVPVPEPESWSDMMYPSVSILITPKIKDYVSKMISGEY